MKGKGLTIEMIVDTALQLVEEKGYGNFSVRELALRMDVKAASLYNHVNGVEDINREVGKLAATRLNGSLARAVEGKTRDEAVMALAYAYRGFVKENQELYKAIIGMPGLDQGDGTIEVGRESMLAIRNVVCQYQIQDEENVHFSRCFRSALHGFALLEAAGYFTGKNIHSEESFRFLVKGYADWLHRLEEQQIRG